MRRDESGFARLDRLLIKTPRPAVVCFVACTLSAVLVFALPFAIPVKFQPVISASYVAGFNNRAAAIAAALLSLATLLWSWRRNKLVPQSAEPRSAPATRVSLPVIAVTVACTCAFTALAGWSIHTAGQRYIADAGYFIEQMSTHAEFGGSLYKQLEFAYGPLLFYPTIWLQRMLHCSMFTAHFITLAVEQSLGLLELAYVLNVLPITAPMRRTAFLLFTVGALNPLLGLNYTLFRYLTPIAFLLWVSKRRLITESIIWLALCEAACLGISAEMGFGFAIGAAVLVLMKAKDRGTRWLIALLGPAAGGLVFVATFGHSYFQMLRAFAGGALNLPVAPYPHLLVFLFAVVWLVPIGIGRELLPESEDATAVAALYAFGLATLPSALGRCDPIHVFFVGIDFLLLSLLAFNGASRGQRLLWTAALLVLVVWQITITNRLFRFRTADTLRDVLPARVSMLLARVAGKSSELGQHLEPADSPDPGYVLDVAQLEKSIGTAKVATPLEITPGDEAALKHSNHFQTSYFAFMVDTFSASAEAKKIEELNRSDWALVPAHYDRPFIESPSNLQDLQGFSFPFPARHLIPFVAGEAMSKNLHENWRQIDELGPYLLLQRVKAVQQ